MLAHAATPIPTLYPGTALRPKAAPIYPVIPSTDFGQYGPTYFNGYSNPGAPAFFDIHVIMSLSWLLASTLGIRSDVMTDMSLVALARGSMLTQTGSVPKDVFVGMVHL